MVFRRPETATEVSPLSEKDEMCLASPPVMDQSSHRLLIALVFVPVTLTL